MRKIFVSLLGIANYQPIKYSNGVDISESIRFVQEATLRFYCADWTPNDVAVFFLTKEAKEKNWLNDGHRDRKTGELMTLEGLKSRLENSAINLQIVQQPIPDGLDIEEFWQIFDIIYNVLEEGDQVVFDITYGFRSLPMLLMVLINYAKFLKNIEVLGIYYGAYDAKEHGVAPIIDLTSFSSIQDWTSGADDFLRYGNVKKILELTKQRTQPILAATKGKDKSAKLLNDFSRDLATFTQDLQTCRGRNLIKGVNVANIKTKLPDLKNSFITPLNPILGKIEERMADFDNRESIENGLAAVNWCKENNLVQQGFTLLQETVITAILIAEKLDYSNKIYRNIVSSCFTIVSRKYSEENWTGDAANNKAITQRILDNPLINELKGDYESLGAFRNDLNHAGFTEPRAAADFASKLEKSYNSIKVLLIRK